MSPVEQFSLFARPGNFQMDLEIHGFPCACIKVHRHEMPIAVSCMVPFSQIAHRKPKERTVATVVFDAPSCLWDWVRRLGVT